MRLSIDICTIASIVQHELAKNQDFFVFSPYKEFSDFASFIKSPLGEELCFEFAVAYLIEQINKRSKTSHEIINAAKVLERYLPLSSGDRDNEYKSHSPHNIADSVSDELYYNILEITGEFVNTLLRKVITNEWQRIETMVIGKCLLLSFKEDFRIKIFNEIFGDDGWNNQKEDLMYDIKRLCDDKRTSESGDVD